MLQFLENAAAIWFIVGLGLFLLEFALPGLILFFFGIGAWITGLLALLFPLSINLQLFLFLGLSLLSVLLFRKWAKKYLWRNRSKDNELKELDFSGQQGKAETFIGPGKNGKVFFRGTTWDARSEDVIQEGEMVTITGNQSILLIVQSTVIK